MYSFSKPFELLHADIADIRFFAKSAADPHYCLLFVDYCLLFVETWQPPPIDKINFKLTDNDTKIAVRLDALQNLNFKKYMYEWENTVMVYSYFDSKWYKCETGWIIEVHILLYGIWARDKKVVNDLFRGDIANYFLKEKDAIVIAHEENFEKRTMIRNLW